jgi:hypothetical protein
VCVLLALGLRGELFAKRSAAGRDQNLEVCPMRRSRLIASAFVVLVSLCVYGGIASAASLNGKFSEIPAYYDGTLFTIHFVEFSAQAEKALLASNKNINIIYQSDQAVAGNFNFISVIDTIQGDGFNPVWQEVQIVFLTIPFQQFLSDNDVLAAAALNQIELIPTTEVYWCPVVGKK